MSSKTHLNPVLVTIIASIIVYRKSLSLVNPKLLYSSKSHTSRLNRSNVKIVGRKRTEDIRNVQHV